MKPALSVSLAVVMAATFCITAAAQPAATGPRARPMDCTKAKDRARCEALNKDIDACKDKVGDEWRACMHLPAARYTPPKARDCSKARNQELCESHNAALEACRDKTTRAEHRKCMATPAPHKG